MNTTKRGNLGRSRSIHAIWVTALFAVVLGSGDTSAAGAMGLEARRGDARDGQVEWNAGIVAAPNGLLVDGRAARSGPSLPASNKSAGAAKTLINSGALSGLWFNPAQDGHGFNFTFMKREGANDVFAVTWYVYRNGAQVWLAGAGEVIGNSATAQVVVTSGAQFPPLFNAGSVTRTNWGTISINVVSCSRIDVSWAPVLAGYSPGSLTVQPIVVSGGTGATACQVTGGGGDDHGNSCATATTAFAPGVFTGSINPAGDADFFRINVGAATTLSARSFATTTLDPVATLYDANCNAIATNDDGGGGVNFFLERAVPAGTYFLGVTGFGNASTGNYSVELVTTAPPGNSVTLVFNNQLLYPANLRVNGVLVGSVAASSSAQQTFTLGSTLDASFELVRPIVGGVSIGDPMIGIYDRITNPAGTITFNINNVIGTTPYFIPRVNNNTGVALLMGVNVGLVSENLCNCVVPAFQQNTIFGYYRLFSNSNVRGYRNGSNYTGPFIFWDVSSAQSETGLVQLRADFPP